VADVASGAVISVGASGETTVPLLVLEGAAGGMKGGVEVGRVGGGR
jgi:hypothetical protein